MSSKALTCLLAAIAVPAVLFGADSSHVRSPLTNTGVDTDASGTVLSLLQPRESLFQVEVANLEPNQDYSLKVGLITESDFKTDKKGRARLRFSTKGGRSLLDFDPRGKTVAVLNGEGAVVLEAVVSGEGEPARITVDERADLAPEAGVKGKGSARYVAQKNGRQTFEINLDGVSADGLRLFVNGIDRGAITSRGRSARITFSSEPREGQPQLDFDPRGAKIDIFGDDDSLKFSGTLVAKVKGVNVATRNTKRVLIPAASTSVIGQAEAKLRTDADASKDFSVELENVPAGTYDLLVNDTLRGTIIVTTLPEGGTKGEIEFTTDEDDDNGELPLTFDPVGATLTIKQDATVLFTGKFNPSSSPAVPAPGTTALITEILASTGLDTNAKAEAEFSVQANGEREFEVEVEDVDAGNYQLFVGGVQRGTIAAQLVNDRVKGKLKFEAGGTGGEDRLRTPLRKGGDDSGGDDNGGGGHGGDDPAGDDNGGTGGGTDDPAGDDHGGTGGGGGDQPKAPRLPLRFDPRGQLIEIKNDKGTYFSHVFGDGTASVPGGIGTGVVVPGEISIALISSGQDANATAEAEFKRDEQGGESFEIEVEDLSVGSYELLVGGQVRGTINVVTTDRGARGKLEFDDEPDTNELPLTFDPLGQTIKIQKDGIVYFERTFPSGS